MLALSWESEPPAEIGSVVLRIMTKPGPLHCVSFLFGRTIRYGSREPLSRLEDATVCERIKALLI